MAAAQWHRVLQAGIKAAPAAGRIPGCTGKVETSGSFSACSYIGSQPWKGFGETWLQDPDLELISAVSFESKLITVGFGITMLVGKAAKTPLLS